MKKIFLRFTIKGDNFSPHQICDLFPLNTDIYEKGKTYPIKFGELRTKPQKTNRWVLSLESENGESINALIKRFSKYISSSVDTILLYTKRYYSILEIIVYESEKTSTFNVKLSKASLSIIKALNTKFSLTFIDF